MSRLVCFIPAEGYVEGYGWRVAFVKEGETGYYPTGQWPCPPGGKMPWFWGHDYEEARRLAEQQNERAGISKRDAALIIARSMQGAEPEAPKKKARR